jgi:RNA polymerase sigma-70 factor (ECF subfamily)
MIFSRKGPRNRTVGSSNCAVTVSCGPYLVPTAIATESDETLAARAGGGCRSSFAVLIERHYDGIYRMAWRWAGSRTAAEDVAQDVCVKLVGALRAYRAEAAFRTWLYRIVYTTALDHMRRGQRMVTVEPSQLQLLTESTQSADAAEAFIDAEIWDAVRTLPPQQRDAVLLVYAQEMSHAAAAEIMGCSEKTVSWHVHEAKKKLKILLRAVG